MSVSEGLIGVLLGDAQRPTSPDPASSAPSGVLHGIVQCHAGPAHKQGQEPHAFGTDALLTPTARSAGPFAVVRCMRSVHGPLVSVQVAAGCFRAEMSGLQVMEDGWIRQAVAEKS